MPVFLGNAGFFGNAASIHGSAARDAKLSFNQYGASISRFNPDF